METRLNVKGHYTSKVNVNDTYTVELYDGTAAVDSLDFVSEGGVIYTAPGYAKTTQGARKQAQDYWL